jgi:cytochrome c oxidase subunit II
MKRLSIVTVVLGILLAGCSSTNDSAIARGKELYQTGGASAVPCATCHTLDGSRLVGPSFKGISERAGETIPGLSAEDYIRQSIEEPSIHIVDGYQDSMYKQYGQVLNQDDIDGLVAFLMTQ